MRTCLNLYYKNVYSLFLSETRRVFEEIAGRLPQKSTTKLQPTCEASLKAIRNKHF